jgi:hypothetical protein
MESCLAEERDKSQAQLRLILITCRIIHSNQPAVKSQIKEANQSTINGVHKEHNSTHHTQVSN